MNSKPYFTDHYEIIRKRWDSEESLLVSRTGIFLMANSILFTAYQLQKDPKLPFTIGLMVFSVVISFLWLTTSWHSYNVIARLYREAKRSSPEVMKCIYEIKPVFLRPNTVLCKIMPVVVIVAWIVYLGWFIYTTVIGLFFIVYILFMGLVVFIVFAQIHTHRLKAKEQDQPELCQKNKTSQKHRTAYIEFECK